MWLRMKTDLSHMPKTFVITVTHLNPADIVLSYDESHCAWTQYILLGPSTAAVSF